MVSLKRDVRTHTSDAIIRMRACGSGSKCDTTGDSFSLSDLELAPARPRLKARS
jgi:hypothetical protein